jgi:hypothetical protein
MIDRRRSAPLQLENAEKLESGQVGEGQVRAGQVRASQVRACQVRVCQVRANQVKASRAVAPPTLVTILYLMSRVRRLPMPDIAFRNACFDASNACFAE